LQVWMGILHEVESLHELRLASELVIVGQ
jgi:hypothetical protein